MRKRPTPSPLCIRLAAIALAAIAAMTVIGTRASADELIRTGRVEVFGIDRLRESVITRAIPLREGDPFSWSLVQEGKRNLFRVPGVDFADIRVSYQPEDSAMGLRVFVTERSTLTGNVWLERGYENEFSLGMRALDTSIFGTGHRVETEAVMFNNTMLRFGWENPWAFGERRGVGVRATYLDYVYVYDDFVGQFAGTGVTRWGGDISLFKDVGDASRVSLRIGYERASGIEPGMTVDPDGDAYATVRIGGRWDRRGNDRFPFTGTYAAVFLSGVGPLADELLAELEVDLRAFTPIGGRLVGALQLESTTRRGAAIPVYRREHIGGGKTLRGWEYGTFDGDNTIVSGAEVRLPVNFTRDLPLEDVLLGISLHVFADAAVAWNDSDALGSDSVHAGAGIGAAILNRQVRGLRFDYGWRRGGKGIFHFEVGLKF